MRYWRDFTGAFITDTFILWTAVIGALFECWNFTGATGGRYDCRTGLGGAVGDPIVEANADSTGVV